MSPGAGIRGVVEAIIVKMLAGRPARRFNNNLLWSEKSEIADVVVDIGDVHCYPTHCLCGLIVKVMLAKVG